MMPHEPVTIICFGDSLTAGYQSSTPECPHVHETPYGGFLQERLGSSARVEVSGVCGELTGEMVMRFRRDVLERRPGFVVLLGGTNDLGWNAQPQEIMRNLVQMFEQALAAGIAPVAVTVPSIRMDGALESGSRQWFEDHIRRRVVLNRLLLNYAAGKGIACADLFTATAEPESLALAARYSNDGLHLTTEGYRTLAALVYECVSSQLTEQTRGGNR